LTTLDTQTKSGTSPHLLRFLAAVVWYGGSIALLLKGGSLLREAVGLRPEMIWPGCVLVAAVLLGLLKTRYVFVRSCRKNLARIYALHSPRPWQFYTPRFFLLLSLMIATGSALSRMAHGHYIFLLFVALLDLSIGVALLLSSREFWRSRLV
jgi:hypothetical protein